MIKSMTGFGAAEGEINGLSCAVEIKAVNNRYLKTTVKLPEVAAFLEEDIEKLLRQNFSRGTISYVLRLKDASASVLFDIDEAALGSLMQRLNRVRAVAGSGAVIDVGSLLNLPGIIRPALPDMAKADQVRSLVLSISQEAIEKLKQMRAAEGSSLEAELECYCELIKKDLEQIRIRSATVIQEYAKRLKKTGRRAAIRGEIETRRRDSCQRSGDSCRQVRCIRRDCPAGFASVAVCQGCQADDQAGRRLDFISQEMLREANTIASKASDARHYSLRG